MGWNAFDIFRIGARTVFDYWAATNSSLRAFGPGGGQIRRGVRVSAREPFEFLESSIWCMRNDTF